MVFFSQSSQFLEQIQETNGFYIAESRVKDWQNLGLVNPAVVFTTKHEAKYAVNALKLAENPTGSRIDIDVDYNLNQILLPGISLDWSPFYTLSDCDSKVCKQSADPECKQDADTISQGQNCKQCAGILDSFLDTLRNMFNMTFSCNRDPQNNWGVNPLTGSWYDPNATFNGVFGGVINGDYDTSISSWDIYLERGFWIDFHFRFHVLFTFILDNFWHVYLHFQYLQQTLCNGLQLGAKSPRNGVSYEGVFKENLVYDHSGDCDCFWTDGTLNKTEEVEFQHRQVIEVLKLNIYLNGRSLTELSERIVELSAWLFFVLLSSYYGGILTSFLIENPHIPFYSLREGLLKYPDWKFLMLFGADSLITVRTGNLECHSLINRF